MVWQKGSETCEHLRCYFTPLAGTLSPQRPVKEHRITSIEMPERFEGFSVTISQALTPDQKGQLYKRSHTQQQAGAPHKPGPGIFRVDGEDDIQTLYGTIEHLHYLPMAVLYRRNLMQVPQWLASNGSAAIERPLLVQHCSKRTLCCSPNVTCCFRGALFQNGGVSAGDGHLMPDSN